MNVDPVASDVAPIAPPAGHIKADAPLFAHTLDDLANVLAGANRAESAFARGAGSLQDAVYERARADVALAVATAAAQRTVSALQSIFNMQV